MPSFQEVRRSLLATRVEASAHRKGLSMRQLALRAKIPLSTLQKIYGAEGRQTSLWTIAQIAEQLEVSMDYLAGLSDDPRPRGRRTEELADSADGEEAA